jgi:hypothetical protein
MFEVGQDILLTVPKNIEYAAVQVTYQDGSKSDVRKFVRQK